MKSISGMAAQSKTTALVRLPERQEEKMIIHRQMRSNLRHQTHDNNVCYSIISKRVDQLPITSGLLTLNAPNGMNIQKAMHCAFYIA